MKVTKAQAAANRAHVVETASQLFRERGFDGVGVADLMAAAGFSREHRDGRATGCTVAALGGDAARQPESVRVAFADGVERLVAALSQQNGASDTAGAAQARARNLDVVAHAVGALVMSRACPDDSPLADEILAVSRDAILKSLRPRQATRAASRRRNAG